MFRDNPRERILVTSTQPSRLTDERCPDDSGSSLLVRAVELLCVVSGSMRRMLGGVGSPA